MRAALARRPPGSHAAGQPASAKHRPGCRIEPFDLDLLELDQLADAWAQHVLPVVVPVERIVEANALLLAVESADPDVLVLVLLVDEAADDHDAFLELERNKLLFHEPDPGGALSGAGAVRAELEQHQCLPEDAWLQDWHQQTITR